MKIIRVASICVVLTVSLVFTWFVFYSRDIPHFSTISGFAPSVPSTVVNDCSSDSVLVIPYKLMGQKVVQATRAAEGDNEVVALQIARDIACDYKGSILHRHLLEFRASVQLRRRFSSEQLVTIYLNKSYFGDGIIGIESAAHHYFGKNSADLDLAEAAMISGLLRAPSAYSPERHPDRARTRRDAVLNAMVSQGSITLAEAQAAMQTPLR